MTRADRLTRRLGAAALAAMIALLASCGGGSTVATTGGVGTGGTGISSGTVTGFGSLVLDGTPYSSASPVYYTSTDQDEKTQTASTAVNLGDQLQIRLDAQGQPSQVVIDPDLVGPVANLGANGFTVNGVPVTVNANPAAGPVTYYTGLSDFSSLHNGMQVEVHGAYGQTAGGLGFIQATRIAQLPSTNPVRRLTGVVSQLDAASGRFLLGQTPVQTSASTVIRPSGVALANGQLVNVWSNTPPAADGTVLAGAVNIRTLLGVSGPVQVGGLVSQLAGARFQVAGVPVDAGATNLVSAVQAIANGEYVVVQGRSDPSTGVLIASSLRTYASHPAQVELRGTITGFVDASNFLVRGVPVDASAAHVVFAGGAASTLRNGVYVDVIGQVGGNAGNVVSASQVTVLSRAPDGGTVDYQGTVSTVDPSNRTFTLVVQDDGASQSLQVMLAPNVVFEHGTAAQLVAGASVEVEATQTASGLLAYTVSFQQVSSAAGSGEGAPSKVLETKGTLYNLSATSFQLNGLTIQINGAVVKGGTLANGVKVEVSFIQSGGQNLAQQISIDD
ncbi:MAG: DUF5666 domain-containing protein [Thiomonas sp.]